MGLDSVVTLALGLGTGGTAERRLRPGPGPRVCPAWGLVDQRGHMQDWVPPSPAGAPDSRVRAEAQGLWGRPGSVWLGQVGRVRGGRNPGLPFKHLLYGLSLGPWTTRARPQAAHSTSHQAASPSSNQGARLSHGHRRPSPSTGLSGAAPGEEGPRLMGWSGPARGTGNLARQLLQSLHPALAT